MIKKIAAIAFIYLMTVFAWIILGATVQFRTYDMDAKLKRSSLAALGGCPATGSAPDLLQDQRDVHSDSSTSGSPGS